VALLPGFLVASSGLGPRPRFAALSLVRSGVWDRATFYDDLSKNIQELRSKARFIRITSQGLKESHVHDVIVTEEAPKAPRRRTRCQVPVTLDAPAS